MSIPGPYTPLSPTQAVNTWADNFWGPMNVVNGYFSQTSANPPVPGPAYFPYGINIAAGQGINAGTAGSTGIPGTAQAMSINVFNKTAIAQATATKICTFTVPNVSTGAAGLIIMRSSITQASHTYDSTMGSNTNFAITRLAGAVAVAAVGLVTDAGAPTEATKASGYILTSVLSFSAVSGGATAVNTFDLRVTNTGSTSSTSETEVIIIWSNGAAGGITVA